LSNSIKSYSWGQLSLRRDVAMNRNFKDGKIDFTVFFLCPISYQYKIRIEYPIKLDVSYTFAVRVTYECHLWSLIISVWICSQIDLILEGKSPNPGIATIRSLISKIYHVRMLDTTDSWIYQDEIFLRVCSIVCI